VYLRVGLGCDSWKRSTLEPLPHLTLSVQ